MKRTRNSAKAVIVKDGCLLVINKKDDLGDYYILPGGGQNYCETLTDAVRREVKEETSLIVSVGDILFVREYISAHHEFAGLEPEAHQVEFMFRCSVSEAGEARMGDQPDGAQVGVRWIRIADLLQHRLYPLSIRSLLMKSLEDRAPCYLGDIN